MNRLPPRVFFVSFVFCYGRTWQNSVLCLAQINSLVSPQSVSASAFFRDRWDIVGSGGDTFFSPTRQEEEDGASWAFISQLAFGLGLDS